MIKKIILFILIFSVVLACNDTDAKKAKKAKKSKYVSMKQKRNLKYNNKSFRQKLDVYYPKKVKKNNDNPVVIFLHGGSFESGSRYSYIKKNRYRFTKAGYVYIPVDYRLTKDKQFPAAVDDAKTAIRYLKHNRKKLKINTNKITICGYSAGANLGSLVTSTSSIQRFGKEKVKFSKYNSKVAGFIGIAGFYDYDELYEGYGKNGVYNTTHAAILKHFKHQNKNVEEYNLALANPKRYVKRVNVPVLLEHGSKDKIISIEQSTLYHKLLKENKKNVKYKVFKGSGHGYAKYFQKASNYRYMINWMNKNVRK